MIDNQLSNQRSRIVDQKGENLLRQAEDFKAQSEQDAAIAEEFNMALQSELEVKQNQIEGIEDRLDLLIKNQEARLLQLETTQPGFLSRPGKRPEWRKNFDKQQDLLQRLQTRREIVREIKDGTGSIFVATSEYSKFAKNRLPERSTVGNITAIVGWYNDKDVTLDNSKIYHQLTLRAINDLGKGYESYLNNLSK